MLNLALSLALVSRSAARLVQSLGLCFYPLLKCLKRFILLHPGAAVRIADDECRGASLSLPYDAIASRREYRFPNDPEPSPAVAAVRHGARGSALNTSALMIAGSGSCRSPTLHRSAPVSLNSDASRLSLEQHVRVSDNRGSDRH